MTALPDAEPRTLVLRLTPEGERVRAAGERRLRAAQDALLSRLAPAERERLRTVLTRLADPVPAAPTPPTA